MLLSSICNLRFVIGLLSYEIDSLPRNPDYLNFQNVFNGLDEVKVAV